MHLTFLLPRRALLPSDGERHGHGSHTTVVAAKGYRTAQPRSVSRMWCLRIWLWWCIYIYIPQDLRNEGPCEGPFAQLIYIYIIIFIYIVYTYIRIHMVSLPSGKPTWQKKTTFIYIIWKIWCSLNYPGYKRKSLCIQQWSLQRLPPALRWRDACTHGCIHWCTQHGYGRII